MQALFSPDRNGAPVVVSQVIIKEIRKHYDVHVENTKEKLLSAITSANRIPNLKNLINLDVKSIEDSTSKSYSNFDQVISSDKIVVLGWDYIPTDQLFERYFAKLPPFHDKDGKPNKEFPDAAALMALDEWSRRECKRVVVVTNDFHWLAFCAESDRLVAVETVSKAISLASYKDIGDNSPEVDINKIFELVSGIHDGSYPNAAASFLYNIKAGSGYNNFPFNVNGITVLTSTYEARVSDLSYSFVLKNGQPVVGIPQSVSVGNPPYVTFPVDIMLAGNVSGYDQVSRLFYETQFEVSCTALVSVESPDLMDGANFFNVEFNFIDSIAIDINKP